MRVLPKFRSPFAGDSVSPVMVGAWPPPPLPAGMITTGSAEAVLTLPAASVAVAVKLWLPLASAPVVYVHAPLLFVAAVPSFVELSNTVIVLFASAVPFSVTVAPLTVSLENTGAAGAVVSICGPLWVRPVSDRLAALPFMAVAANEATFCPAATV